MQQSINNANKAISTSILVSVVIAVVLAGVVVIAAVGILLFATF